jgi:hypothetical protein
MADLAIWATACETALWPNGAFARAYEANRRAAVEGMIEADPVAARVREIMAERSTWTGCAVELLRTGADLAGNGVSRETPVGRKIPVPRRPLAVGADRSAHPGYRDHVRS